MVHIKGFKRIPFLAMKLDEKGGSMTQCTINDGTYGLWGDCSAREMREITHQIFKLPETDLWNGGFVHFLLVLAKERRG